MERNEKTQRVKQKEIINKIIKILAKDNMQMYYNSHSDIANEIVNYIKSKNELNKNELELISQLSATDISIILSLNS